MTEDEYWELREDIETRGFRDEDPIVLYEGKILDGRHRYRVCQELNIEPSTREYEGDDPAGYVISANLHRRHLEPGQRAATVFAFKEKLAEEAAERKAATQIRPQENKPPANSGEPQLVTTRKTHEELASLAGVGKGTIDRVARVQRDRPDLMPKIESGEMTAHAAFVEATGYDRTGKPPAASLPSPEAPKTNGRKKDKTQAEAMEETIEHFRISLFGAESWPGVSDDLDDSITPDLAKKWATTLTKAMAPLLQFRKKLNERSTQ